MAASVGCTHSRAQAHGRQPTRQRTSKGRVEVDGYTREWGGNLFIHLSAVTGIEANADMVVCEA